MTQKTELKRELGLLEVTLSGVGIILGAGIYALIGVAAGRAGNALWLSFVMAALIAAFTGLSYAELSSMFPRASAEYEYTSRAFNQKLAFVIGWLVIFSGIIGDATVALGFGGYFYALTEVPVKLSAVLLILALSLVLFRGIKLSAWFAIVFTLIEAGGLIMVILIGLPHLGSVDYFEMPHGFSGVFEAAALIFFAYMGFEEIVKLSEETKNPESTVPKSLVLALTGTIILYILVALSSVSVVGWEQLSASNAPFAEVAFESLGNDAFVVISIIALFATANTVLLMLLAASRITYGMAESFGLPSIFSKVHPATRTPWVAIFVIMVVSIVFTLLSDIAFVASATNFVLFLTFAVINAALIALRYKEPQINRPFKVPINLGRMPLLPVFGIIASVFLALQLDRGAMEVGLVVVLVGFVISFVCCDDTHD